MSKTEHNYDKLISILIDNLSFMTKSISIAKLDYYLVGGAVRDQLLNLTSDDKDWVVVGSSAKEMLNLGFTQVGKDFPVFLHPNTHEEYALARTERKQGKGYTGFVCDTDISVSLVDDLLRRDITINAMAMGKSGEIIDPYQGKHDLDKRVLRHVSSAFIEDPLRVLRVARFAARFFQLGFTIAPETMALMKIICQNGELNTLSNERVWQEMYKSLQSQHPEVFFSVLSECSALREIWPELNTLWKNNTSLKSQSKIDFYTPSEAVLKNAVKLSKKTTIRFASLLSSLKK